MYSLQFDNFTDVDFNFYFDAMVGTYYTVNVVFS